MTGFEIAGWTALGTVVATAIIGGVRWLGRRARRQVESQGIRLTEHRLEKRAARVTEAHDALVNNVRRRAQVLGKEIPESVSGRNPAAVTWYPSGAISYHYDDHARYRADLQARRVDPRRSWVRRRPTPLSSWTDEELETWLREHRHELPNDEA